MTANTLNALKGWPAPAAVDFNTLMDPSVTTEVLPGSVVHLNSSGYYVLGVGNLKVMPMFTFDDSLDPDVVNQGGDPSVTKGVFIGISPTGQLLALVAVGAYELVSTAFVSGTYNPNDHLTSPTTGVNAGLLQVTTSVYGQTIVGLVSRGIVDNGYGFDGVAFWPWYIPPNAAGQ
jgi:hypothetical protein